MIHAPDIADAPREQLSRSALLYVIAAFAASLSLVAVFLPWWILPVAFGCIGWRLLVFTGRVSFPSSLVRTALVFLAGAALFLQYRFTMSLDVFVMLLLLGFSLKLLELYRRGDAQLLLYLAFFVLMTVFLFEQSPFYALLVFAIAVLVLAALVAVQSANHELLRQWWQPLQRATLAAAFALPVMLFMFLVMPRLPPLWRMPLQTQQQARTGMHDSMGPGDVAELAQSSELSFRAVFSGALPPRRELYWYGILLDRFDGKKWTETCHNCPAIWQRADRQPDPGDGNHYQVILEPQSGSWLYALMPSSIRNPEILVSRAGVFRYTATVDQRTVYEAIYLSGAPREAEQVLPDRAQYLALPKSGNTRSLALAAQWRAESGSDAQIVQKALAFYHDSFFYTLQPPPLGDERIDDFLFNTHRGFCEHFAGSFVFLMRAAGIPARVAMGYMGGEINERDHYVMVRQYDAHAWAEVWLEGKGWQRIDPTSAVAPDRIELGFAEAFAGKSDFAVGGGLANYGSFPLLKSLRLQMAHFDYLWVQWVLGYESENQQQLLQSLGLVSPLQVALWGGGGVCAMFAGLCLYLYWRQRHQLREAPATQHYRRLCETYAAWGLVRLPAETPLQFAARVVAADLAGAETFAGLSQDYYRWCYGLGKPHQNKPASDFFSRARRLYWQLRWQRLTGLTLARKRSHAGKS